MTTQMLMEINFNCPPTTEKEYYLKRKYGNLKRHKHGISDFFRYLFFKCRFLERSTQHLQISKKKPWGFFSRNSRKPCRCVLVHRSVFPYTLYIVAMTLFNYALLIPPFLEVPGNISPYIFGTNHNFRALGALSKTHTFIKIGRILIY